MSNNINPSLSFISLLSLRSFSLKTIVTAISILFVAIAVSSFVSSSSRHPLHEKELARLSALQRENSLQIQALLNLLQQQNTSFPSSSSSFSIPVSVNDDTDKINNTQAKIQGNEDDVKLQKDGSDNDDDDAEDKEGKKETQGTRGSNFVALCLIALFLGNLARIYFSLQVRCVVI